MGLLRMNKKGMHNIGQDKRRFLHILPDEKVVNTFIRLFEEVYPGMSTYVIYGGKSYPSSPLSDEVLFFNVRDCRFRSFLKHCRGYNQVVLHYLPNERVFRVLSHPQITVIAWGADIYETLFRVRGFKLYFDENEQYRVRAAGMPVFLYRSLAAIRSRIHYSHALSLLKRAKQIGAADCDYKLLEQYFPNLSLSRIPGFGYYPIDELIGKGNAGKSCSGTNIWVNNSSNPNGNHVTVFNILKTIKGNSKVFVPISYGDLRFVKYIDQKGRDLLGTSFHPLTHFLPPQKYYGLFLSVNTFIFGHLRQCAMGNIVMALYFGGKCYLFKENPLYQTLKDESLVVFSIEDDLTEDALRTPLSQEDRKTNREIVWSLYSKQSILHQIHNSFSSA